MMRSSWLVLSLVCACGDPGGPALDASVVPNQDLAAPMGNKRVFVSSLVYSGNLGGIAGADAKCNTLA
jgi:hypothetical protein